MQLSTTESIQPIWKCISCRMQFQTLEDQRMHYQTEFHAENSRRASSGKPPMTQLEYQEYLNYIRQQQDQQQAKSKKKFICQACDKQFSSQAALQQHVQSNKHMAAVAALAHSQNKEFAIQKPKQKGSKQLIASTSERAPQQFITERDVEPPKFIYPPFLAEEEKPIFDRLLPQLDELSEDAQEKLLIQEIFNKREPLKHLQCVYCDFVSQETENPEYSPNQTELPDDLLQHLDRVHYCTIPLPEFIPDKQTFYKALQDEMAIGRSCIRCGKEFGTVKECQEHCNRVRHSVVHAGDFIERFQEFYDFTSSYPEEFLRFIRDEGELDDRLLEEIKRRKYVPPPACAKTESPLKELKKLQLEQGALLLKLQKINQTLAKTPKSKKQVNSDDRKQNNTTYIQLFDEKQNIINQINTIYKNAKDNKCLLHIADDPNAQRQNIMPYNEEQNMIEQNKRFQINKEAVYDKMGESISKFKRYFKRSTKVWLKCQK